MTSDQAGTGADPAGISDGDGSASGAETFWEPHYRAHEGIFNGTANPVLVEVAEALAVGTALDLGCGEGGDAIWLARRGWRVTAADVSPTALARGARHAEQAGVAELIDFQQHDLTRTCRMGGST